MISINVYEKLGDYPLEIISNASQADVLDWINKVYHFHQY